MAQRAATIEEVRLRLGPAFSDPPITDAVVQVCLDDTACFVSSVFGECQSTAHAYAAAHCVWMSPYSAGIVIPENLGAALSAHANGPASRSFSVPAPDADAGWWSFSSWGRTFLEYRRKRWGKGSAVLCRTGLTGSRPGCR